MKKVLYLALAATIAMSSAAYAQTANSESQSFSQSGAIVNQNSTSVRQAPGAVAPGLAAAGIETCTSSASSGISGPGFGFSFGGTGIDEGCEARLDARTLAGLGLTQAGIQRLCERPKIAVAMYNSGQFICPQYADRAAASASPKASGQQFTVTGRMRIEDMPSGSMYRTSDGVIHTKP